MTRDEIGLIGSGWEIIGDNIDCDQVWAEKGHEGLLTRDKSRWEGRGQRPALNFCCYELRICFPSLLASLDTTESIGSRVG